MVTRLSVISSINIPTSLFIMNDLLLSFFNTCRADVLSKTKEISTFSNENIRIASLAALISKTLI